jgi:signal-transduction protein with cAMP-binding, CBS, and nucleotidyltransferase domain
VGVREAARQMTRRRVGSVVVCGSEGHPLGILTDTDLRARVLAGGADPEAPVGEVMSRPVRSIHPKAFAFEAMLEMIRHRVHHLVVSEGGRLLGVISDHDLRVVTGAAPVGVVRDFVVGKGNTLDLKMNGVTPFVDAARIFALASGVTATSTLQRLRKSAAALHVPESEVEAWIDAFLFIQMLRLRHHYEASAGMSAAELAQLDNLVDPAQLNELDRRILKESFRQARKVQAKLALDYQL